MLVRSPDRDTPRPDRLFPRAYLDPTEEDAEAEWQSLVHDDLVRAKLAALRRRRATLARRRPPGRRRHDRAIVLDAEQEEQLLGALNDARLVARHRCSTATADEPTPTTLEPDDRSTPATVLRAG